MDSTPPSSPRRRDPFRPPALQEDAHHTFTDTTAALFSPDSKSADTDGTGATGSTEPPGAATRSLLESVQAREDAAAAAGRCFDVLLGDDVPPAIPLAGSRRDSDESWHCVEQAASGGGGEQMETTPAVHLPTPEPEERFRPSAFRAADVERGLHPSDSASNPLDGKISKVDFFGSADERQDLAAPSSLLERDALEREGLTDSQEDVLLAQSVTRSQSDFSHWLHETLRLAQGDGTSTVSGHCMPLTESRKKALPTARKPNAEHFPACCRVGRERRRAFVDSRGYEACPSRRSSQRARRGVSAHRVRVHARV